MRDGFHRLCGWACGPIGDGVDRRAPFSTSIHNSPPVLPLPCQVRPHECPLKPLQACMRSRRCSWALVASREGAAERLSPPSTAPMTTSAISLLLSDKQIRDHPEPERGEGARTAIHTTLPSQLARARPGRNVARVRILCSTRRIRPYHACLGMMASLPRARVDRLKCTQCDMLAARRPPGRWWRERLRLAPAW